MERNLFSMNLSRLGTLHKNVAYIRQQRKEEVSSPLRMVVEKCKLL